MAAADEENPAAEAEHWASARAGLPPRKTRIHASLDADVVDWFKQQGRGYQNSPERGATALHGGAIPESEIALMAR